jgi:hypothetical protein
MPLITPNDMEYLGSIRLNGSAATTGVLAIPARERLTIHCNIAGYSGGDIASLRFNGDAGANYWDRHISYAAGGVTPVNAQNVSTTLIRLAAATATVHRMAVVDVINIASLSKVCSMTVQTATQSAANAGILDIGSGEWVNTSAQITSVEMRTAGGSITMPAGTSITVFGVNP